MISSQIARDAAFLVRTQPISRTEQPKATDPLVARMDAIDANRTAYDRDAGGLRRSRDGNVGGVQMMVQVATSGDGVNPLASETLLIFRSLEGGHQRRLLVTGLGDLWIDANGQAVWLLSNNKYILPRGGDHGGVGESDCVFALVHRMTESCGKFD